MLGQEGVVMAVRLWVATTLVVLSSLVMAGTAQAAGRVFYDGFESGNTNLWDQDESRIRCRVVESAADQVAGPFAGSRMVSCNWNGTADWSSSNSYETLKLRFDEYGSYNNELFVRVRLRADRNLDRTTGASAKILRFTNDVWTSDILEVMSNVETGPGLLGGWTQTYWGWDPGDFSARSDSWHKVEYYFNRSTGKFREWHDGILVIDQNGSYGGKMMESLYITSNFSNPHDATNNIYFDEFEVFTDKGSGASGSMSDASVSASSSPAPAPPTGVVVQ